MSIAPTDLYCWVDYSSVPQSHTTLKRLAINTLGTYAAMCRYFIAIVPTATHAGRESVCGVDSYMKRGWCRLEQWARLCEGGAEDMYMYTDSGLEPLSDSPKVLKDATEVYQGVFTDPEDKTRLVDVSLTLWARLLQRKQQLPSLEGMWKLVNSNRENVFPVDFFHRLPWMLEERVHERMSP